MELEKIENKFVSENIENFLTPEKFEEFKDSLQGLAKIDFKKNEAGRKEARSIARKVGTLKTKITEKFDELIKAEKAKNDEYVKYSKLLTSTKAKYLAECTEIQSVIKRDVNSFDQKITSQIENMERFIKQYETLDELNQAKKGLIEVYDFQWEEKRKDAEKQFSALMDKLIMQENIIARLEQEKSEREELERQRQEQIIKEQAQRLNEGKNIELPKEPEKSQIKKIVPVTKSKEKYTLVFDTETTSVNPQHARIVQIGAVVFDDSFKEVSRINLLVKQDTPIPPETIAIHGKTDEMCERDGVFLQEALMEFKGLYDECDIVVAHNMPYDQTVIERECERSNIKFGFNKPKVDTKVIYKDIVKCPPTQKMIDAGRNGYKDPKLSEAYHFVFGKDFDNAHDALSDVLATADLYHNFMRVNRAVKKEIIDATGCSDDVARLVARNLSAKDLTNYKA